MDVRPLLDRARLRFCVRMTIAAVLAFAVTQFLALPLHGLWAVLTAVVATQMSVGRSLQATAEYVIGTIGGAVYASAIGVLVPHTTALAMAGVLALAIAPLAYAAVLNPSFRVAPFTAVMLLLIATSLDEGPIESAVYRLLEVALGGGVAVAVSLLILPERALGLGRNAAARVLEQLARVLPDLLAGFTSKVDVLEQQRLQGEIGRAVAEFEAVGDEAKRERLIHVVTEPDPAVLARTLLRLRHDLVIIGRAGILPLPHGFAACLAPCLAQIAESTSDYLLATANALVSQQFPPPLNPVKTALAAYASKMTAIRHEGVTHTLSSSEVERIFALGFALEQLRQDLSDLARCVQEWTTRPGLARAIPAASPSERQSRSPRPWFRFSAEKVSDIVPR